MGTVLVEESREIMPLHIYAQNCPHDTAMIVGDMDSLRKLRETLKQLLDMQSNRTVTSMDAFTADGEEFKLFTVYEHADEMEDLRLPYTSPEYRTTPPKGDHPSWLIDK